MVAHHITARKQHRFVGLIVALLVAIALSPQPASADISKNEARLATLVNRERESRGLSTLKHNATLSDLASKHSAAMMEAKDPYLHSTPKQLRNYMDKANCVARIGENVGSASSVQEMHDAFMASPGHKENILEKYWVKMGMGIKTSSDDRLWVTELFCV